MKITLKDLGIHFAALSYNANTVVLYFNSANHFLQHMGYEDLPLTEISARWRTYPLTAILFFDGVLFISNQTVFPERLKKLLGIDIAIVEAPELRKTFQKILAYLSGFFKATITSTSLLALLNEYLPLSASIATTAVLLPGNFAAQFSILFEPFIRQARFTPHPRVTKKLAAYSSFAYALANAALYFNAINRTPNDLGWTSRRIANTPTILGRVAEASFGFFSLQFVYATYLSFIKRIDNILLSQLEEGQALLPSQPFSFFDRCTLRATTAALWKAAVTTLSLMALFAMYEQEEVGYVVSGALFFGNLLSQLTLYAPDDKEMIERRPCYPFFYSPNRFDDSEEEGAKLPRSDSSVSTKLGLSDRD